MGNFLAFTICTTLPLAAMQASFSQLSRAVSEWYLVAETIEDTHPDYRSDIYFADKTSIMKNGNQSSVAISHLILSQEPEEGDKSETRIRDIRSNLAINCDEQTYSIVESAEYDQDNMLVSQTKTEPALREWHLPGDGSGHANIVQFACDSELKLGEQKFKEDILPLVWLMAFLSADWRN
ncbi:surface-adhesin E family protein [Parasphingorhabdus sp.]|uniref:surface-adhesin E family protein n=1 Tax=Parasphingorhabdus sp. TaxID=2709688 RepID=UPI003264ED68